MSTNNIVGVGIVAVIIVVVIMFGISKKVDTDPEVQKNDSMITEEKMMMEKKAMEEKDAMMKKDGASMMEKADTMMKAGSYEAYSAEKVMLASSTHDVVLFFRASWCPSCRAVDADIKSNLGNIPAGLTILDVNYDDSSDLKKKYGVTYQHTFVQVDKDGNMIKKWSGSPTLAKLVSEVK